MVKYIPTPGDVVWITFDPQRGKEIQKTRPALTVSPYKYHQKTHLGLFMPITSQIKGYPFEVAITLEEIEGAILSDQIRCLDWHARKATFIAKVPPSTLQEAIDRIKLLLG